MILAEWLIIAYLIASAICLMSGSKYVMLVAIALLLASEIFMPGHYNIRVDLFLTVPLLLLIIVATAARSKRNQADDP
jgi:membrane protein implicated in regulation of membrane protease activity